MECTRNKSDGNTIARAFPCGALVPSVAVEASVLREHDQALKNVLLTFQRRILGAVWIADIEVFVKLDRQRRATENKQTSQYEHIVVR